MKIRNLELKIKQTEVGKSLETRYQVFAVAQPTTSIY